MRSMKKIDGVLTIAAALLVLAGTTGCQSGWKFSNPFSRAPKASHADAPEELDDDFAEVDDITPPPENYTVGDSVPKQEKKSIAQEGKYGDDEESRAVAASDDSAPAESFATRSYAQTYQAPTSANSFANGVGSSTPSDARQYAGAETLADTVARLDPAASAAAASQPYVPQNSVAAQTATPGYPANSSYPAAPGDQTASIAQNQAPGAADAFPSASSSLVGNPIAQVSAAAPTQTYPQPQVEPQRQPTSVALNYDPNAPVAAPNVNVNLGGASAAPSGSDPYADVVYTPQTTSGGFAPGSVRY